MLIDKTITRRPDVSESELYPNILVIPCVEFFFSLIFLFTKSFLSIHPIVSFTTNIKTSNRHVMDYRNWLGRSNKIKILQNSKTGLCKTVLLDKI